MKRSVLMLTVAIVGLTSQVNAQYSGNELLRGDGNNDTQVSGADPIYINNYLYNSGSPPPCMDAADANDDGAVNSTDVVYLLYYLYNGGSAPPAPFPTCGHDPTSDYLSCNYSACH